MNRRLFNTSLVGALPQYLTHTQPARSPPEPQHELTGPTKPLAGGSARQGNRRTQCEHVPPALPAPVGRGYPHRPQDAQGGGRRDRGRAGRRAAGRLRRRRRGRRHPSSSDGGGGGGKTTITLGLFGTMGFKEAGLYDEYEKLNPNINIQRERRSSGTRTTTPRSSTTSPPAAVSRTSRPSRSATSPRSSQTQARQALDLSKVTGVDKSNWLDWKWTAGHAPRTARPSPSAPTSARWPSATARTSSSRPVCPPTATEVGKLWAGDWDKFVDVGKRVQEEGAQGHHLPGLPRRSAQRDSRAVRRRSSTTPPARSSTRRTRPSRTRST